MLPTDFVILDYEVGKYIPIIIERPFLSVEKALMNSKNNKIKFLVLGNEVVFRDGRDLQFLRACRTISIINIVQEVDKALEPEPRLVEVRVDFLNIIDELWDRETDGTTWEI